MENRAGDRLVYFLLPTLPKKEERDKPPAAMNIPNCPARRANGLVSCPGCHLCQCRKHGFYLRKGFHAKNGAVAIPVWIPRYRCLNPECPRCTFSILPPMVMRYCRFFWPCLLTLSGNLDAGVSPSHLSEQVWHVGRGVILRAAALMDRLGPWVERLHREITDGKPMRRLELMVKIIAAKLGRPELVERWYRHRYPSRFY